MPPLEAMACEYRLSHPTLPPPRSSGRCWLNGRAHGRRSLGLSYEALEEDEDLCIKLKQKGIERAAQFSWKIPLKNL